ncbi:MAG: GTPase Era [Rhodospirillales bacterium]
MADDPRRAGFVAVVGAPNAGKSTLVNQLVGAKVTIVTPKAQTTRARILAICVEGDSQIVFVDTPGIFAPRRRLDRAMVAAAWTGAGDADEVVLVVDATARVGEVIDRIVAGLRKAGRPAVLVLNKIDLIKREKLLGLASRFDAEGVFTDIFMVSALTGDGVADLRRTLAARLPEGPWLYPEDQLSDINDRLFAAEITREQLFLKLYQEVPYSLTVETEEWEEFRDGSVRVKQAILVERDTQRAIVLGKGGHTIKTIGAAARAELEGHFGRKVHLLLEVLVRANWAEDPEHYDAIGLEYEPDRKRK